MINNKVTLAGTIATRFLLDHEYYNERFYHFFISVKRTSGTVDNIPVIVSERLIDTTKDLTGCHVSIVGEFRSFSLHNKNKTRLLLYVFPLKIELLNEPQDINNIFIQGVIRKTPVLRETPYGRVITDILLTVNREYDKCDYIPCIAWGRNAVAISGVEISTKVRLTGRIQSRDYDKNGITLTAYEVSVNLIESV